MRQLLFTTTAMAFALVVAASAAQADCVAYSAARAQQAGAALARNPPAATQPGLPTLDGLVLDAAKTSGDPKCDGPTPKRYFYTTTRSMAEIIEALYPNIRRRAEEDGMGRVWFRNPLGSDRLFLTSGTEMHIQRNADQSIWQITVDPPDAQTARRQATRQRHPLLQPRRRRQQRNLLRASHRARPALYSAA